MKLTVDHDFKDHDVIPNLKYFLNTPDIFHYGYVLKSFSDVSRKEIFDEIIQNFDRLVHDTSGFCYFATNFPEKEFTFRIISLIAGNESRFRRLVSPGWNNLITLVQQFPLFAQLLANTFMSSYPSFSVIPSYVISEIRAKTSIEISQSDQAVCSNSNTISPYSFFSYLRSRQAQNSSSFQDLDVVGNKLSYS